MANFGLFLFSLELCRFPAVFKRLMWLLIVFTPGVLQGLLPGFFQLKLKAVIHCLISFMAPSGSDSFRCLFGFVQSEDANSKQVNNPDFELVAASRSMVVFSFSCDSTFEVAEVSFFSSRSLVSFQKVTVLGAAWRRRA